MFSYWRLKFDQDTKYHFKKWWTVIKAFYSCVSGWPGHHVPQAQQGRSVLEGMHCHWPLHSNWQYSAISAQGTFEWVISQCYLSWTYDRFCTLDKEKSNNNDSSGKKKSLILISFSVYQKPFSRECDKISCKSCLLYLISSTFPPQICSSRNTVNANMYPNVKCYLHFTIHDYIFWRGKYSVS